jgi:hypothetical protein
MPHAGLSAEPPVRLGAFAGVHILMAYWKLLDRMLLEPFRGDGPDPRPEAAKRNRSRA